MLEMLVKEIGINAGDRHPVVILQEKNGSRILPIWIGPIEFGSITMAFRKFSSPRPQTHDLLIKLLEDVGVTLTRFEITKIANDTFYGNICLITANNQQLVVDCRPSDGIALALRKGIPIMVAQAVFAKASHPGEDADAGDSEFKKFVESVKASDFANCIKSIQIADDIPIALPESTSSTSNIINAESKSTESDHEGGQATGDQSQTN